MDVSSTVGLASFVPTSGGSQQATSQQANTFNLAREAGQAQALQSQGSAAPSADSNPAAISERESPSAATTGLPEHIGRNINVTA